jgi:hypothetical protein
MDGTIDVTLCGEMNNGARLFARQERAQNFAVDDIAPLETVARMGFHRVQVNEIARVREFVEIEDARLLRGNPLQDEVRANEAGAAGDEDEIFHAGIAASGLRSGIGLEAALRF